jgi:transcriptional regulator with XRE-family HTH domain
MVTKVEKKHPFLVRFGSAVKKRRVENDFSQEALAERAELHRTYVADIERGVRNVSLVNVQKLARALRCSVGDLCDNHDRQHP